METASIIICSILMIVGLLGVVLPVLPGIPLAWLGLFIYALVTGFERISIATVIVFFHPDGNYTGSGLRCSYAGCQEISGE